MDGSVSNEWGRLRFLPKTKRADESYRAKAFFFQARLIPLSRRTHRHAPDANHNFKKGPVNVMPYDAKIRCCLPRLPDNILELTDARNPIWLRDSAAIYIIRII